MLEFASLSTIQMALDKGAKVILLSHLGRPDLIIYGSFFRVIVANRLIEILNKNISFQPDWFEESMMNLMTSYSVRMFVIRRVKKNDEILSQRIASLCDVYVMDAFGASHRKHSSTYGVLQYAKRDAGPLLSNEVSSIKKRLIDQLHL